MSLTDARPLDLFGSLLAARGRDISVEIVAPDVADIARRIGEGSLGNVKEVKLRGMKFEEYVDGLSESMPALMRKAAAIDTEIRSWIERIYISSRFPRSRYSLSQAEERSRLNNVSGRKVQFVARTEEAPKQKQFRQASELGGKGRFVSK